MENQEVNNQEVAKVKLTVSGILADLENGLTRTSTSAGYNPEIGCIQDKYGLSDYDIKKLFQHSKLKGRKTCKVPTVSFELEDDVIDEPIANVDALLG